MLEVELDIFSGMPNPTWMLSEPHEERLYELLRSDPTQISPLRTTNQRLGLGYRGVIVRRIKIDDRAWDKAISAARKPFPNEFRLGLRRARGDSAADWLVTTARPQGARISDEALELAHRADRARHSARRPSGYSQSNSSCCVLRVQGR